MSSEIFLIPAIYSLKMPESKVSVAPKWLDRGRGLPLSSEMTDRNVNGGTAGLSWQPGPDEDPQICHLSTPIRPIIKCSTVLKKIMNCTNKSYNLLCKKPPTQLH